jgi:16S rRNA (guanine527-N7)-methyltransferase
VGALRVLLEGLSTDPRAPTAVRGRQEALDRHLADALVGLELDEVRTARVAGDLGSGAGVPGLVLAAALPELRLSLIESQRSKCAYAAALVAAMGLRNVEVVCSRAELWGDGRGRHDLILARALAAQPVVLEYAAPLLAPEGTLVEWRGQRDPDEEQRGGRAAHALGLRLREVRAVRPFAAATSRHLHVFEKVEPTPPGFPRRAGVAARRPLGG